jgi:hypothetical protein
MEFPKTLMSAEYVIYTSPSITYTNSRFLQSFTIMFTTRRQPLDQVVLRYAGFVQGLVALPCMVQLISSTYLYWFHQYDVWYWFT